MHINIASRFRPFSHLPGAKALLPGSFWQLQAFPTRLFFTHLQTRETLTHPLELKGPIEGFTLEQDLEKGRLRVFGKSQAGYFSLTIQMGKKGIELLFEKRGEKIAHLLPVTGGAGLERSEERLSFGIHKAQECEGIWKRLDPQEILPFWLHLSHWVPPLASDERSVGVLRLIETCEKLALEGKREKIVPLLESAMLCGFRSVFMPRLDDDQYLGILEEEKIPADLSPLHLITRGRELIRSLLFREEDGALHLLPCLPPEFVSGRLIHARLQNGSLLDLEWSKKLLRRAIIHPRVTQEVELVLPKPLSRFRVRKSERERGKTVHREGKISLRAGESILLDHFEK